MRPEREIRIGTRGSPLALRQAEEVARRLQEAYPGWAISLIQIRTRADAFPETPFAQIGEKGLFVKEIEEALLSRRIDLAVHSMKDVPTDLPPGLCLGAVPLREDPRDCLLGRDDLPLEELAPGAAIGTSSLRRRAQIEDYRPDFQVRPLRGNLESRIRKLTTQGFDAIILAAAGLHRLGLHDVITQYLPVEICLPAAGQGALGLEVREEDETLREALQALNHEESACAIRAERAFLRRLGGGCQIPVGILGRVQEGGFRLHGAMASPEGGGLIRGDLAGPISQAERIGEDLADRLQKRHREAC